LTKTVGDNKADLKADMKAEEDRLSAQMAKLAQEQSTALTDFKTQTTSLMSEMKQSLNQATQGFATAIDKAQASIGDLQTKINELNTQTEVTKTKLEGLGSTIDKINSIPLEDLRDIANKLQAAAEKAGAQPSQSTYLQFVLRNVEGDMTESRDVIVRSLFEPPLAEDQVSRMRAPARKRTAKGQRRRAPGGSGS